MQRAVRSSETKHREKNMVVLALLCWLFMERIHPSFCALWVRAMRVGILGSGGSKRGSTPHPPSQTCCGWCLWLFKYSAPECTQSHAYICTKAHREKTNTILRGNPDLCVHLRSDYSPFCCTTSASPPADLLSASCCTVR